jgi:nitrate reductase gamma subunit
LTLAGVLFLASVYVVACWHIWGHLIYGPVYDERGMSLEDLHVMKASQWPRFVARLR